MPALDLGLNGSVPVMVRYRPVISPRVYFVGDGSGMTVYDDCSGDTYFLHLDSKVMKELFATPSMSLDDIQEQLSISPDEAFELAHEMISLGLIVESS